MEFGRYGRGVPPGGLRPGSLAVALVLGLAAAPGLQAQNWVTCPERQDGTTGLAGTVRDSASGTMLPGATVTASWSTDVGLLRSRSTKVSREGSYVLCGLPVDRSLAVFANFHDLVSEPITLAVEPGPPAGWDFSLNLPTGVNRKGTGLPGKIIGRITDRSSDGAVQGAAIRLVGENIATVSDGGGRYELGPLQPGVYRVRTDHIGFETVEQVVQVLGNRTLQMDFGLTIDAVELEPLVVTALREESLELSGFYDRMEFGEKIGGGFYATREDIKKSGSIRMTHFLGQVPGVRVQCFGYANNNCSIRMTRAAPSLSQSAEYGCVNANVWVDGVRQITDLGAGYDSIDNIVMMSEVAGVEVYRGPSELPAQFGGSSGRCGAIVIWTGGVEKRGLRVSGS